MVVLGGVAVSYERGTPVVVRYPCSRPVSYERGTPVVEVSYERSTPVVEFSYERGTPVVEVSNERGTPVVEVSYERGTPVVEVSYERGTPVVVQADCYNEDSADSAVTGMRSGFGKHPFFFVIALKPRVE